MTEPTFDPSVLFIGLAMAFVWSYVCTRMARSKGRNTTLAGALGFFFGLFAVIGYAIARPKAIERPGAFPAPGYTPTTPTPPPPPMRSLPPAPPPVPA